LKLLLDTQILLWTLTSPKRLSAQAESAISTDENRVFVSLATPWEMAIKTALGNLAPPDDLEKQLEEKRFELLPIALRHTRAVASLPHLHGDPFDRMLIAQAQVDGMTLVTSDRKIRSYPVATLPVTRRRG
jgi:PIN domain nuclease of toxin-antitoxin system